MHLKKDKKRPSSRSSSAKGRRVQFKLDDNNNRDSSPRSLSNSHFDSLSAEGKSGYRAKRSEPVEPSNM